MKDFETKYIVETTDPIAAKRLTKADDMAKALFEIVHNAWREFKHTDKDYHFYWQAINDVLDEHNINVNELWQ